MSFLSERYARNLLPDQQRLCFALLRSILPRANADADATLYIDSLLDIVADVYHYPLVANTIAAPNTNQQEYKDQYLLLVYYNEGSTPEEFSRQLQRLLKLDEVRDQLKANENISALTYAAALEAQEMKQSVLKVGNASECLAIATKLSKAGFKTSVMKTSGLVLNSQDFASSRIKSGHNEYACASEAVMLLRYYTKLFPIHLL
jgi:hypothetical protein